MGCFLITHLKPKLSKICGRATIQVWFVGRVYKRFGTHRVENRDPIDLMDIRHGDWFMLVTKRNQQ